MLDGLWARPWKPLIWRGHRCISCPCPWCDGELWSYPASTINGGNHDRGLRHTYVHTTPYGNPDHAASRYVAAEGLWRSDAWVTRVAYGDNLPIGEASMCSMRWVWRWCLPRCSRLLEGRVSKSRAAALSSQGESWAPDLPTLLSLPSLVRTADEAPILPAWVGPRRETGDIGPTNRLPHPRGHVFGHICVPFIRPIERDICLLTSTS